MLITPTTFISNVILLIQTNKTTNRPIVPRFGKSRFTYEILLQLGTIVRMVQKWEKITKLRIVTIVETQAEASCNTIVHTPPVPAAAAAAAATITAAAITTTAA